MDVLGLGELQLDALREVANIGAGHAATALSELTGRRIMVDVPEVRVVRLEEVGALVGDPGDAAAAVFVRLEGDVMRQLVRAASVVLAGIGDPREHVKAAAAGRHDQVRVVDRVVLGAGVVNRERLPVAAQRFEAIDEPRRNTVGHLDRAEPATARLQALRSGCVEEFVTQKISDLRWKRQSDKSEHRSCGGRKI